MDVDVSNGTYAFVAALPQTPGCYDATLYLSQEGFSTSGSAQYTSAKCTVVRDPSAAVAAARIVALTGTAGSQQEWQQPAEALAPVAPPGQWQRCPGYYEELADSDVAWAGVVRPARVHRQWRASRACPTVAASARAPAGAGILPGSGVDAPPPSSRSDRYFSVAAARQCLAGRWLAFVGDSTVEEVAIATTVLAGVSFSEDWTDSSEATGTGSCWHKMGFKAARSFDSSAAAADGATPACTSSNASQPDRDGCLPPGTRVTMHWAGGPTPCYDLAGLRSWDTAAFVRHLTGALAPDLGGTRRPTVVFNSMLHDLGTNAPHFSADEYTARLGAALDTLVPLAAPPLIWKTGNPKTGRYSCAGGGYRERLGQAAVDAANALALGALASRGVHADVLDEGALLMPLGGEDGELHEHHCAVALLTRPPRVADQLGAGCVAAVHALLHLLCPGGAHAAVT